MSGAYFLGFPEVRFTDRYEGGRTVFVLLRPFTFHSEVLGRTVTVPAGFESDGESVPRDVDGFLTGRPSIRAGLGHDWLYRNRGREFGGCSKEQADRVYKELMLADGVDLVHAEVRYRGVVRGGQASWDSGPVRLRVVSLA